MHEALDDAFALRRVGYFRMKLQPVKLAAFVSHCGNRCSDVVGDDFKTARQYIHLVAMTHPHVEQTVAFRIGPVLDFPQQFGMPSCTHFGITEFTHQAVLHLAAELRRHGLHAVADAQHRHADLEHDLRSARRVTFDHRGRAAG